MSRVPANSFLKELPVDRIVPNRFNPNRMSAREFAEYVAEVRRLGRLPKASVVRPKSDGNYEIVDGEHGWRAAIELGMKEILCEVRDDMDDFHAKLECYKRNRGGKDNPVLLGRLFLSMLEDDHGERKDVDP